jgi:hypothetical protein
MLHLRGITVAWHIAARSHGNLYLGKYECGGIQAAGVDFRVQGLGRLWCQTPCEVHPRYSEHLRYLRSVINLDLVAQAITTLRQATLIQLHFELTGEVTPGKT